LIDYELFFSVQRKVPSLCCRQRCDDTAINAETVAVIVIGVVDRVTILAIMICVEAPLLELLLPGRLLQKMRG